MIKRSRVIVWQQTRGTGFVLHSKSRAEGSTNSVSKCVMETGPKERKELFTVKTNLDPRVYKTAIEETIKMCEYLWVVMFACSRLGDWDIFQPYTPYVVCMYNM